MHLVRVGKTEVEEEGALQAVAHGDGGEGSLGSLRSC